MSNLKTANDLTEHITKLNDLDVYHLRDIINKEIEYRTWKEKNKKEDI